MPEAAQLRFMPVLRGFVPFHRLEIVLNGRVVASRDAASGTREMTLTEKIRVPGLGLAGGALFLTAGTRYFLGVHGAGPHVSGVSGRARPGAFLASRPQPICSRSSMGQQAFVENLAIRPDPEACGNTQGP